MLNIVKVLVGVITGCITFLSVAALYVIWSPEPLNSPLLWRCSATAGLFAFVSAILLSLIDTLRKHSESAAANTYQQESNKGAG